VLPRKGVEAGRQNWRILLVALEGSSDGASGLVDGVGFPEATAGPEQFGKFLKEEIDKWAGVIKASGIHAD